MYRWTSHRILFIAFLFCSSLNGQEIGFVEQYALAENRADVLDQLVPGTEKYYYYNALYHQSLGEFDKVDEILSKWIADHKTTNLVRQIQNRQALLQFESNPAKTYNFLRKRLKLNFNHQREIPSAEKNLPSQLDSKLIQADKLRKDALRRHSDLSGFNASGLEYLASEKLSDSDRRHLLKRLVYPDFPNLVEFVIADLQQPKRNFGEYSIHRNLTLKQLESCLESLPKLKDNSNFVNAYLSKLLPNNDVNWREDKAEYRAYLDRLYKFSSRLNPVFNSLKANIVYRLLELDRSEGKFDRDRFFEYLKLPKDAGYVNRKILPTDRRKQSHIAKLGANHQGQIQLSPIGNDYDVIFAYLNRFLADAPDTRAFAPYIESKFLKSTFATIKLLNGVGDKEVWAAQLSQSNFKQLKDRVDIDFSPTKQEVFKDDEVIAIDLFVKNVDSLIVKVYEINELNFYRRYRREIDTDVSLDGLVPNYEDSYQYDDDPLVRTKKSFEFEQLKGNGVFVIDFIGGGKSSRALIRRGRLSMVGKTTVAGQLFHVFDHNNQHVKDGEVWIAGNRYEANQDGVIIVPFTNRPSNQVAIISADGFSSQQTIKHLSEQYELNAGIYVDRESLLSNRKAKVLIRPSLRVAGVPASVSLLENAALNITSINQSGITSTKRIDNLNLNDDAETECEFVVPPRLKSITFHLDCTVENISQSKTQILNAKRSFDINQIDKTDEIQDVHLLPSDNGYMLEVRGKSGELRAKQAVRLSLIHHDFRDPVYADLVSDQFGRIQLGELNDIAKVMATVAGGSQRCWNISQNTTSRSQKINTPFDRPIEIAAPAGLTKIDRSEVSLLEKRGNQFAADRFDKIKFRERSIVLNELEPGDYVLRFKKSGQIVNISVSKGDVEYGVVLGQHRRSELRKISPLFIRDIVGKRKEISVELSNANKLTRVHVLASRYSPGFDSFREMAKVRDIEPWMQPVSVRKSAYMAGRKLSDEHQYILNRRYETKYPGNMLSRPSVLASPWAVRDTKNQIESLAGGEAFKNVGAADDKVASRAQQQKRQDGSGNDFANLDFSKNQSVLLSNLQPDKNGVVTFDVESLKGMQHLRVIAVDAVGTVQRSVNLPPQQIALRDLRLSNGLDPGNHFSQTKQIDILNAGDTLTIEDLASGRFSYFDDLGDVFRLYLSLNPNTKLNEFQFLLRWSEIPEPEKRELYTKFACHELNFYLHKKDRAFFDQVVSPHVSYKSEQGFIDQFLTRSSLENYVDQQWMFGKLNVFERILLSQRSRGQAANIIRNVEDLYFLNPVQRDQFDSLYDRSIQANEMELGRLNRRAVSFSNNISAEPLPALFDNPERAALANEGSIFVTESESTKLGVVGGRMAGKELKSLEKSVRGRGGFGGGGGGQMKESLMLKQRVELESSFGMVDEDFDDKLAAAKSQTKMELGDFAVDAFYFQDVAKLRRKAKPLYRRLPTTKEWIEQQYYQLPLSKQNSNLVQANRFWKDYSQHTGGPFLSKYLSESHRTFTEMMFALAVLDLPEKAPEHKFDYVDNSMDVTAAGPMVAMHQQFQPVVFKPRNTSILVSENFYQKNDRFRKEDGIQYDKFVTGPFYAHTLYGAQVVVTNPTSTPQAIDLLVQVPNGSVATSGSQETRSMQLQLDAFNTKTFEYFFYFPTAGEFTHYPAHVTRDDEVLAFADNRSFAVIDEPRELDKSSWGYVSQNGTEEDVIEFLKNNNVLNLNLGKIAFRMKSIGFFERVINTLKNRRQYDHVLWSYGLHHNSADATQEFLRHEKRISHQVGRYLDSQLLAIEPYQRNWYQHREYSPLINARTYKVNAKRQILNPEFHQQYHRLLEILALRKQLTSEDHLVVTYYLLLQNRISEAIAHFGRVDRNELNEEIQFDYCSAYLDFYLENPADAESTAMKWKDYPVELWRNRFRNILAQVDEIRGTAANVVDQKDRDQKQTQLASQTQAFDFSIESGKVKVAAQAISTVEANYYEMDIELMFSSSPFELKNLERFSVIQPIATQEVDIAGKSTIEFAIPQQFSNRNVLVELRAGDQVKAKPYFANSMYVQTVERFGQIHVTTGDGKKPVSKAYVKVYSQRNNGKINFHKDGYTDLRGRFDYVSQSNNPLDGITNYSILILSPEFGAVTRQASPPSE